MKQNSLFNEFDVVKFTDEAAASSDNAHVKDYIGIVREIGNKVLFIEWFDAKSSNTTREVTSLTKWWKEEAVQRVGSLWYVLGAGLAKGDTVVFKRERTPRKPKEETPVVPIIDVKATTDNSNITYSANEPDEAKALAAAATKLPASSTGKPKLLAPLKMFGKIIFKADLSTAPSNWKPNQVVRITKYYVIPTGVFKHFKNRKDIEASIESGKLYTKLYKNINSSLDFAIVGDKPGPSKIQKFRALGIPMITEEEWLALNGHPDYAFDYSLPAVNPVTRDIYTMVLR